MIKLISQLLFIFMLGVGMFSMVNAADPLSRDGLQPTLIPFDANTAVVSDTISSFPDVAYFMITVPDGEQLTSIMVTSDENSDGGYWFAVMSGTQFTETSVDQFVIDVNNILGHTVIRGLDSNHLPVMGNAGIGFDGVLPAGDYAFRIQNWQRGGTFTLELTTEPAVSIPSAVQINTITADTTVSPLLSYLFLINLSLWLFYTPQEQSRGVKK